MVNIAPLVRGKGWGKFYVCSPILQKSFHLDYSGPQFMCCPCLPLRYCLLSLSLPCSAGMNGAREASSRSVAPPPFLVMAVFHDVVCKIFPTTSTRALHDEEGRKGFVYSGDHCFCPCHSPYCRVRALARLLPHYRTP